MLDSVPSRQRRYLPSRNVSVAGILLVLAAVAAALVIAGLASDDGRKGTGGGNGGGDAAGAEVELTDATDFDPIGGDGELPAETSFAVDNGNKGTSWVGEHYDSEDFGGLKDGVGIFVKSSEPVEPTAMAVVTPEPGWDAEVYSAVSDPPDDLNGWEGPIGTLTNGDTESQIPLEPTQPSQYFLLWFTKLAPASDDDRFRPEVSDVQLLTG